ncbi:ankyrin repeat-containing domain protein [Xylariomycetidae sp. FL2044]|nr:ankyrin repeat-containing domain protein [Xylariomycetidae sp. FL2044]
MDPLSLTVAASQLLGAVNTVIVIVAKYNEEMNKTPRDLAKFVEELRGLRSVLETLESLVLEAKKSNIETHPKLRALIPLYEPLTLYLEDIKALQSRLELPKWYTSSRRRRSIVIALGWPLADDEAKRELEKMKSFREQLRGAIQVDTIHIAVENQRILYENQRILTELVKSWRTQSTSDHRRELNRWLAAPDPSSNYQSALKRRNTETGLWFVNSEGLSTWMRTPCSFFWVYGIAGCGKTILTTSAIEKVTTYSRDNVGVGIAYYYFDFTDKEKQISEKLICSILKQLSMQCPETPHVLSMLFTSCEDTDRPPSSDELLETLRHVLRSFADVYIIIDALDECSEVEELLEYLGCMMGWGMENLHILASSRPERVLEEGLRPYLKDDARNKISVQSDVISDDLRTYIRGRLATDTKLKRWHKKPEVQAEIETALMQKADGMFRLVVCQLDELTTCFTRPQLQDRLKSLPKTLDAMYAALLAQIPEEHEHTASKILQWLAHSSRQLTIDEVAEVLCVEPEDDPSFDPERRFPDPRDILEICPSLVLATETNVEDEDGTVLGEQIQLAHYSVKEFLVSKRIQKLAPAYSITSAEANASIAEACLSYLLSIDGPDSIHPGLLEESPLASYAAQYGTRHANLAKGANSKLLTSLMIQLFDGGSLAYANWMRLNNPDKPWQSPTAAIRHAGEGQEDELLPPLYTAAAWGLVDVVGALLDDGADLTQGAGDCGNVLQVAARGGHQDVVDLLLATGSDVNASGGLFGTALQAAAFCGHEAVARQLLGAGAAVNQGGGKYANPLQAAAREGHLEVVNLLLEAGADTSARGGFYGDALQAAAFYGYEAIVKVLIDAGAAVDQLSGGIYGTPLQAACRNGYDNVVKILLDAGAQANLQSGMYHTAVQSAARGAHKKIIERLIAAGADVNAQGGKYGNALQAACLLEDVVIVQLLLDAGADVNAQGGTYGNALQTASVHGYRTVVDVLLEGGADINMEGGYHGNAITGAAMNGHHEIVKLLLDSGCDVTRLTVTVTNASPNHRRAIELLQGAGAEVHLGSAEEQQGVPGGFGRKPSIVVEDLSSATAAVGIADEEDEEGRRDEIRQAALTVKFCDECGRSIPDGARYYHCGICLNDDWDSCEACVRGGFPCRDRRHKMVLRQIRNGMIIDIDTS